VACDIITVGVTSLARIIILERPLDEDKKTIHAIDAGGIAGGEKFLVGSIFFKYVVLNRPGEQLGQLSRALGCSSS